MLILNFCEIFISWEQIKLLMVSLIIIFIKNYKLSRSLKLRIFFFIKKIYCFSILYIKGVFAFINLQIFPNKINIS